MLKPFAGPAPGPMPPRRPVGGPLVIEVPLRGGRWARIEVPRDLEPHEARTIADRLMAEARPCHGRPC